MKKLILFCLAVAFSFSAESQLVPLKVYNGMPFDIRLNSVAVRDLGTCAPGMTTTISVVIPPGGIYTVAPLMPGNASVDWAGAKVTDLTATSFLRAVHPYFSGCWLPSISGGSPIMTGYWYPINSSPFQVLKIY